MTTIQRPKIVFVGGFNEQAGDGSVGGQMYACRTLLNSALAEHVEWITLDSTQESLPPPPLRRRLTLALRRLATFTRFMADRSVTGVLIFTSAHFSFVEKGVMIIIAHLCRKRTVLSPRSGHIMTDLTRSGFMRWFIPFVLKRCDVILCQSESWKQTFQSLTQLPDSRFTVVHNWLDLTPYRPREVERQTPRAMKVLFLGWVERNKGIYELIEAVNQFQNQLDNTQLIICGRGSQLAPAQAKVAELGLTDFFDFRGWVTGAAKFAVLREADVLVLPSHQEGLPNSLLEAMATGMAVIASAVGGIPEVLEGGTRGMLVPPGSAEALGQALVALHSDPARRLKLGAQAKDRIIGSHDIEKIWPLLLHTLLPEPVPAKQVLAQSNH